MNPGKFTVRWPPLQQLMNYVFATYSTLDDPPCDRRCVDCKTFCPDCHRGRYWAPGMPRYDCPNIKHVYLQRFLACHVAQTKEVLRRTVLDELSRKEVVRAISIAGGPGVELLALAEVLNERRVETLSFVNFDKEPTWGGLFDDLAERFDNILESTKLRTQFVERDFTVKGTKHRYDVVFVPWVVSELQEAVVSSLVSRAVAACNTGGVVVVLERTEGDLRELILGTFGTMEGVSREFGRQDLVEGNCYVDFPETIRDRFGPKFDFRSHYFVFRKA